MQTTRFFSFVKFLLSSLVVTLMISCKTNEPVMFTITTADPVTDVDGNVYQTITIGTQTWMTSNLKTTHYRDGSLIANVSDSAAWSKLVTGAYCDYANDAVNGNNYGHLYNGYAVSNISPIAPTGWHVPNDTEWTTLSDYLGGADVAGGRLKETKTDAFNWTDPNTAATNEIGFSALPGGYRHNRSNFYQKNEYGHWWSSSAITTTNYAWSRGLIFNAGDILKYYGFDKGCGFSVRCMKDMLPAVTTAAVSAITSTTAISGGMETYNGGAPITAKGICWSTSPAPTTAETTKTVETVTTAKYASTMTNLTANKTYYVRAYITNYLGTTYGEEFSFTTLAQ